MGKLKTKDYNRPLRAYILECSVREEEAASNVIKSLLRLVKHESKTLDNKSSSLSFKNKIDLLYDIEDLNKEAYTNLIKFMELRNQFIHNPNCNSFQDLSKEAPEVSKFLSANFKNDITDFEESQLESFKKLFATTLGGLIILHIEYDKGVKNETFRFIDSTTLNHFDDIFSSALEAWREQKAKTPDIIPLLMNSINVEKNILEFKSHLEFAILGEKIKILDKIVASEVTQKDIFLRRADLLADYQKRKYELEKEGDK